MTKWLLLTSICLSNSLIQQRLPYCAVHQTKAVRSGRSPLPDTALPALLWGVITVFIQRYYLENLVPDSYCCCRPEFSDTPLLFPLLSRQQKWRLRKAFNLKKMCITFSGGFSIQRNLGFRSRLLHCFWLNLLHFQYSPFPLRPYPYT